MTEQTFNHRYTFVGLYRRKNRRRPYRKRWNQKKAKDKKGFTRYSTGPKWAGQHDFEKPAFLRKMQPELRHPFRDDEMLPCGYSKNQTWVALCKSWNGFLLAKREGDQGEMKQYIGQIRKLQKDLGLEQTEFYGYSPAELAAIDLSLDEDFLMDWYGTTV